MVKETYAYYIERLQKAESALLDNLVDFAQQGGYKAQLVVKLRPWRKTIKEITNGLIRYIEESIKSGSDVSGFQDIASSLAVSIGKSVANIYKDQGVKFEQFLVFTKLCRKIFIALFEQFGDTSAEASKGRELIRDFFDLFDIGASSEWLQQEVDCWQKKLGEIEGELDEYRSWLEDLVDERTEELFQANEKLMEEIVERQQAEEEFRKLTESLKRSNVELEQFAHVASHDMKEPLMLIGAFSERLLKRYGDSLDDKGREYLQRILRSVRKLQQLIDDLLEFSRIRTSTRQLETIALSELMHEIVQDLEECISNVNGTVEIGPLGVLEGDRVQIGQLFQNIIINAMKYRKDTENPNVLITGRSIGEDIYEISVEDNGIGIDEKDLVRIFRPFERLHSGDKYEGTGIGLATCERIVTIHGGTITAKSTVGKGTTFIVRLPRRQQEKVSNNSLP